MLPNVAVAMQSDCLREKYRRTTERLIARERAQCPVRRSLCNQ